MRATLTSIGRSMQPADVHSYEVIIVGAGPTGLIAANLLAQAGHTVAIFERHPAPYNLPRAGHIDEDVLRILQRIGCLDAVMEDVSPFFKMPLLGADGQVLFEFTHAAESPSSFRSGSVYQPVLEDALYRRLRQSDEFATLYQGWTVEAASQDSSTVQVRARPTRRGSDNVAEQHEAKTFLCRYLIAADGAASSIREGLEIEREDYGFNERWLDVDVGYRRSCDFGPSAVVGDPRRPQVVMPLGKQHHRFLWQLLPDESSAEFSTPEKAWALLAKRGVTAQDVEIVRQAVYTFEYRLAPRWREGRIFLMGDAAHTMPPCLGQGLCSGIRDAANLTWKLDLVLRGLAGTSILESYETERYANVKAWSDLSLRAGEILCMTDPVKAAARDARLRSGEVPAWRPPPTLTTGFLDSSLNGSGGVAGQVFPQRTVRQGARTGLLDDLIGRGFLLAARSDPRRSLTPAEDAFRRRIGMGCAWFGRNAEDDCAFADASGEYETFFASHDHAAVIVRPDHHVFGGVQHLDELGGLIAKLKHALQAQNRGPGASQVRP